MSKQDKEPDLSIESSNSLSIEESERGSRRGNKSLKRRSPPTLLPSAPLHQVQAGERSQKLLPIYIHSLFRAGSTYLFQVFRRSTADIVDVQFSLANTLAPGVYYLNCGVRIHTANGVEVLSRRIDSAILRVTAGPTSTVVVGMVEMRATLSLSQTAELGI